MSGRNRRSALLRQSRFESFEERLALSAQPVADFYLTSQVEQRIEMHLEQLEQHIEELQDLEDDLTGEITHHAGQLEQHLGDVHNTTGVNYVYNTYGFTGAGQTVAVIDSGIAWDHVALGGGLGPSYRVVGGWDFAENDADPYDDGPSGFHGTHVAGIIGSDNSTYRGVAPEADLVALRVFDDNGAGYFSWVESALQWVHDHRNDFANPITTVNLSLGTAWNSDSIPNWTTIEDELSQLEQDGIFIAVSAGNSFADYNTPGLSYPAASPYVVPVASVTNAGSFSNFSQRNDRVIAAPGSSITSTVPDYVFGSDGNPNDFGTASGTSMASPYVAGASVLVRQAMEFVGIQNITQDTIYDHIRNTADIFYDAATSANYHRLNVQAALDALMPADDYGSSLNDAFSLGTLSGSSTLGGLIGTVTDEDVFTFTARDTGTISFTVYTSFDLALDAQLLNGTAHFDNNILTFDVTAGESYTISFGTDNGIGYYDAAVELLPSATLVKTIEHNGLTYSLDSNGWLSVNGVQVWNQTQDFSFGNDGTLYWLSTYGLLERTTGQGWQTLGQEVEKYAVSEVNSVYSLHADHWLSVDGVRVWSQTADFSMSLDGSLNWLSTFGLLQRNSGEGWETLGQEVVKYTVGEGNRVYSLQANDWLCVDGIPVWSQTKDFALDVSGSLYWLSTYGLLQRQFEGSWETIERGVAAFELQRSGISYQTTAEIQLAAANVGRIVSNPTDFAPQFGIASAPEFQLLEFSQQRADLEANRIPQVFVAHSSAPQDRYPSSNRILNTPASETIASRTALRSIQQSGETAFLVCEAVPKHQRMTLTERRVSATLEGLFLPSTEELRIVDSVFEGCSRLELTVPL